MHTGEAIILLVEDESVVRHLVTQTLRRADYVVFPTSNAAEALQVFQSQPIIDLVVTDVQLDRDMNGVELAENLLKEKPTMKVLLISGSPECEMAVERRWPVLEKPFSPANLLERVRDLLEPNIGAESSAAHIVDKPWWIPTHRSSRLESPPRLGCLTSLCRTRQGVSVSRTR
jgi:DNA-binding NtrC family response regulator